uniref:Uncharacterized protein n=1 Tax=Arundo donax TaxID=35708 RepID=A0A0A9GZ64_ARUDO
MLGIDIYAKQFWKGEPSNWLKLLGSHGWIVQIGCQLLHNKTIMTNTSNRPWLIWSGYPQNVLFVEKSFHYKFFYPSTNLNQLIYELS